VRYFPGAVTGRRLLALVATTAAAGALIMPMAVPGLALTSAGREDDLKDKQHHVQEQIKQAAAEAEESSHQVAAATKAFHTAQAALADARVDLSDARARLGSVRVQLKDAREEDVRIQAELDEAQARLDQARADVVAGQAALDAQREQVTDTVIGLYQQGSPQLLTLSGYLSAQTVGELTRRMEYADTLVEDEATTFADLHAAEVLLELRAYDVKAAEQQVAHQRARSAEHLRETEELKQQAQTSKIQAESARQAVEDQVARRRQTHAAAVRARKHDLAVLAALKKEEQRIKELILAAAAADHGPGYVGSSDGFLLAPVPGSVTSPFGYRIHPIYGYYGLHDGTDFGVGCGTAMRAAATGTVISAYYSSVYGNRLYLNVGKVNGHNLTVVYNHASSYRIGVGDHVQRGETVGYVGSTGWSTGCHLHFTVLQDGNPVDPMNYL
jgi:murein DD-endopeptidase MepM/ murein hydrolase activator NlpD